MTRSYWFLICPLAAIWGASYLFIKVAVRDFSPPAMMEIRLAFAALPLGAFLVASKGWRDALADVRAAGWHGLAIGVVNGAIPSRSSRGARSTSTPASRRSRTRRCRSSTSMLAPLMLPSERTTGVRLVGFVLGLVGVGVLSGAQPDVTTMFVLGTLAVVLASVSYAFSGLYAQKRLTTRDGPGARDRVDDRRRAGAAAARRDLRAGPGATWKSVASLAALTLFGTALAQLILYRLLRSDGAARTSLVTYLMPPIALVYGALLLDESISAATLGGLALILAGVALGSGALRFTRRAAAIQEP